MVSATLGLLAVLLLYAFRVMIQPTIIALLLTFVLYQPVSWVQQRTGWSRATSIIAVYLLVILILIMMIAIFVPRVVSSFESLAVLLETLVTDLQEAAPETLLPIFGFNPNVNDILQQLGAVIQNVLSEAGAGALGLAATFTTGVLTTIYVLVLGFWLLKDVIKLQRMVMNSLPTEYRDDVQHLTQELGETWMAFLRGQLVLALVIGFITWIIMSIVGMPNAAALALLAGVLEFLPTVGPGISGAIGILVALLQGSTWLPIGNIPFAIIVSIFYIIITQVESVYLIPRLVGRRVRLHPAVTFTGIISAALVFGVLGVLLITPTIASVRALLGYVFRKLRDLEPLRIHATAKRNSDPRTDRWPLDRRCCLRSRRDIDPSRLVPGKRTGPALCQVGADLAPRDASTVFPPLYGVDGGPVPGNHQPAHVAQAARRRSPAYPPAPTGAGLPPTETQKLRDGVPELLMELRQQYKVALITTRSRQELDSFFQRADLPDDLFDAIVTRDDLRKPSPNSEGLLKVLETLNLPAEACLVVGDTELQLRVGEAVGAVQVGLLCGMGETQNFSSADLILESPTDLSDYLNRPQAVAKLPS